MKSILDGIHCAPSRRPVKFNPGPQSRHYLVFDPPITREDRLVLFMELFSYYKLLADVEVVPEFVVPVYTPQQLLEIRVVTDPRHPAYGQAGLYAKRQIPSNTIVTPYSGLVEIFGTSCNSRTYTMGFGSISDDYALDAEFCGNYGRFANDPRGVEGLSANLSAESKFNARGESFTALVARRQISEGEEILMAYGKAHSLGASPWTGVKGEMLMRQREGGVVPLPLLEPKLPKKPACSDRPDGTHTGGSIRGYEVRWECPQCGTWARAATPTAVQLEFCTGCGTPKLSGAKMVALLVNDTECGEASSEMTLTSTGGTVGPPGSTPLDDSFDAQDKAWRDQDEPTGAETVRKTPAPPHQTGSEGGSFTGPVAAPSPPDHVQTSSREGNDSFSVSPSSYGSSSPSPTGTVGSPTYALGKPSPASSSHLAVDQGGHNHHHHHHHHLPHHPHHPTYAATPIGWPMNVPFLPWQIWDPTVPVAALEKHSRFETHEHVFLYAVEFDGDGDDEEEEEEAHSQADEPQEDKTNGRHSRAPGDVNGNASPTTEGAAQKEVAETEDGHTTPARKRGRLLAGSEEPQTKAPKRSSGGRRKRKPKLDLWEKQGTDEVSAALLSRRTGRRGTRDTRQMNAIVDAYLFRRRPYGPTAAAPSQEAAGCSGASSMTPGEKTLREEVKEALAWLAADSEMFVCPMPLLSGPLGFHQEMERLLILHTRVFASHSMVAGGRGVARIGKLPSPLTTVVAAMRHMSKRPFAGKSFRPGDTVAYLGGCLRPLRDSRCRPEHSPLAIPLRYLVPARLRRQLRFRTSSVGKTPDTQCEPEGPQTEGLSNAQWAQDMPTEGLEDLVERLSQLCLVVTNEMMYCPVLVEASYLEEDIDREVNGLLSETEGPMRRPSFELSEWKEDAAALLRACNVALVLTLDALGSPHVVAVATKSISSFEPLLARTQ